MPLTPVASVRTAAIVIAVYGTMVLVNASIEQMQIGWGEMDPRGLPRAVGRFLFMLVIAWGLLQEKRWAWWCGVLGVGFFLLIGLAGSAALWVMANTAQAPDILRVLTSPVYLAAIALMIAAMVFLLLPTTRAVFKKKAAPVVETPSSAQ